MKYMLIMNTPRDGYTQYMKWPRDLLAANAAFMREFTSKLRKNGELIETAGLASPEQAVKVRAGGDRKAITDGVFPESKEFLAGYWLVDVESHERAVEIAAEAATAPGQPVVGADGNSIDHLWIEVRQIIGSQKDLE